ncbi:hypothetical protein [Streptomyces sp. NPDC058206]|uniref:hypothetical protein n=1 Tax=Streptomyces sp. NPDC058206 TaxID=3346382 RepID=UPI0036EB3141
MIVHEHAPLGGQTDPLRIQPVDRRIGFGHTDLLGDDVHVAPMGGVELGDAPECGGPDLRGAVAALDEKPVRVVGNRSYFRHLER